MLEGACLLLTRVIWPKTQWETGWGVGGREVLSTLLPGGASIVEMDWDLGRERERESAQLLGTVFLVCCSTNPHMEHYGWCETMFLDYFNFLGLVC